MILPKTLAMCLFISTLGVAKADDGAKFPLKPVKIIVPVAAGGSADKLTRVLAEKLSEKWGQSVIVENVTGASGTLGSAKVAKAPADGYTLLETGEALTLNALLFKKLPYDSAAAFTPVIKAVVNPQILVVNPKLGIDTFQQYVAVSREKPGTISLGLPTNGGIAQIAHEMLNQRTGGKVNYIPYPGGGPAAVDVIAGHTNATLITLAAVTEYVKSGRLKALAVTTTYRSTALPQVPTMAESGQPGFSVESWQGYLAPAGTPPAIVNQLNRDFAEVLRSPGVRRQLENLGYGVKASTPQELADTLAGDMTRYGKIVHDAGISIQ
ncbi:tripartite tricarboxylate transporter substrate binding protein [Acerihabitans arboris]|uniref:Tripartite tricarboxylate transporter substrate binding protein n=1 Tax=Acerihabitans arboris TaxID=2691583 RepID=A0A845SE32_9GAMM|nr:tripartite tricarboxylate transporter substrate binding protein [Acerihabitans arboris]NDL61662.1 tripartite tricarboxylate transporter substrate binding protein [Acerihabitans arboris]